MLVTSPWTRSWQSVSQLGLLLAASAGLALQAPAAQAVESVQLTYGRLEMRAMPLDDFEQLVTSNTATREIQTLLDLLKIENAIAQAILGAEWEVDQQVFDRAVNSFVANAFFELIAGAIALPDSDVEGWLALRNAAIAAAADGKISVIEVLQKLEGRLLVIDTRQAISIARDLRQDIQDIRALFDRESELTADIEDRRESPRNR